MWPPRSRLSPAALGSAGQFALQPLVQPYFGVFYIYFNIYSPPPPPLHFRAGSAAARSCPGTLTAPRFLLPPSINHSCPHATPHRDRPSLSFLGCVSPQDPLFLPPLHSPDFSLFFTRFGLLDGFFFFLCPEGFLSSPSSAPYQAQFLGWGVHGGIYAPGLGRKGGLGWGGSPPILI